MATGDVLRLNIITANNPNIAVAVNGFHFRQEGAIFAPTPEEDLLANWLDQAEAQYLACFSSAMFLIKYQLGIGPTFATSFEQFDGAQSGGLTGEPLPPRNCAVMSKKTADFSRRGRGRTYLPPPSEGVSSGAGLTTGYRTTLTNFASALFDMATGDGSTYGPWKFVLWSEADQADKDITSYIINLRWGSQRDRSNLY